MRHETVAAWKIFIENPCFKDLLGIMEDLRLESISDEDRVPTSELDIAIIAECRGVRLALKKIMDRVEDRCST